MTGSRPPASGGEGRVPVHSIRVVVAGCGWCLDRCRRCRSAGSGVRRRCRVPRGIFFGGRRGRSLSYRLDARRGSCVRMTTGDGDGSGGAGANGTMATGPIRVCVLSSSYEGSKAATKAWDDFLCTPANVLKGDSHYVFNNVQILKAGAYQQVRALVNSKKYDVFFNLCDGAKDEDRAGISVVQALEEFGVPFTGSDSRHYEPSKLEMKMLAFYAGIKVPPFAHVTAADNVVEVCSGLRFPLIVKHVSGYGSVGMRKESKCHNFDELHKEAKRFIDMFGEVLVEEFIEGVEINVLAFEDLDGDPTRVLHPIQVVFPDGETFKHFDLKWIGMLNHQTARSVADPVLAKKCEEIGLAAFEHILGGVGYGRSDLRVCSRTGEVYLLEINPNCGLFYPNKDGTADVIMELDPFGADNVARHLIQAAINRNNRRIARLPPVTVVFHPDKGYHVQASRRIKAGELVFPDEATPFTIVTKQYVAANWNPANKLAFAQYAWPISNEVYSTWNSDPKQWRPINHSCDPNLWFGQNHSLNVYARVDIAEGDQLTMDYATFCSGPLMHPFDCMCKSAKCRARITHLDYVNLQSIRDTFGTRVTDFIYNEFMNASSSSS
ncbi:hypothetical protein PBRA_003967 [Plasmodiophora brassicae]|nr:hypothetical protein PBRA_003967 [Plasmodiophora brassicae]